MYQSEPLSKNMMLQSRTQFYSSNGAGRDSYIQQNNGGFCPPSEAVKIEELGTFYHQKQRPSHQLPVIHSKGVCYVNNGGGRDTYISASCGGFSIMNQAAQYKTTYYNSLRQYPRGGEYRRVRAQTATNKDVFTRSQNHFNDKYQREAYYVNQYQKNMDLRLSQPKCLKQAEKGKILKNSAYNPVQLWNRERGSDLSSNYQKYAK